MTIVECADGRIIEVDADFRVHLDGALCCYKKSEQFAFFPAGRWLGAYRKGSIRLLTGDEKEVVKPTVTG